jgi:rare lipoprotein A
VQVCALCLAAVTCGSCRAGSDGRASDDAAVETRREAVEWATQPAPERIIAVLEGDAIWYGGKWHGRRTASGERFDKRELSAAHRTLPFGTRVRVINTENGKQVVVRINDRGPYGRDRQRIIDVSEAAAKALGFQHRGSVKVRLDVLAD